MTAYHWIMTVLDRGGFAQYSGTYDAPADTTRTSAFEELHKQVAREIGLTHPPVLFFALEPDQLGGVA